MKEYVWPRPNLKQLAVLGPQYGANAGAVSPTGSRPRYVRITDVTDEGTLLPSGAMEADLSDPENYSLGRGDLLFARSGATVGKTYLYDEADGPCVFAGYMIRFQINEAIADPKYVFYFTKSPEYQTWVGSKQRAAAQPNINGKEYSALTIPLPPLSEQRRIVEILDQADALRKKRAESDRKAERLLPALFLHTFGDPATNPMGWETKPLGDLFESIRNGTTATQNTDGLGYPVSRIETISEGVIDPSRVRWVELDEKQKEKWKLAEGDILFSHINSETHIGKTAIYQGDPPTLIHGMNLLSIRARRDQAHPEFLLGLLKTDAVRAMLRQKCKRAVNQASLNQTDISTTEVPVPPRKIQADFLRIVRQAMPITKRTSETTQGVEQLFLTLLHRAFSGELTESWREGQMKELLHEMDEQSRLLDGGAA